jgi:glucose-6-phosphate 1-dehydrogenase
MSDKISDALVFFGAKGDLAHKMIFPALQRLAKRGELNMQVIGVAKSGWTLEQLKQRAQDSVDRFRGVILNSFKDILNQSITIR